MMHCVNENCDYFREYGECSSACQNNGFKKIVTNFDKIQAMTVEELARFLATPCECEVDPETDGYVDCGNELCIKRHIKWLKSEVSE